jgi:hypothetical protein
MFQVIRNGPDRGARENEMHINRLVERFLREQDMPPTVFGRQAARDPRLVLDMRMGREVRSEMAERLMQYMARYRNAVRKEREN